MPKKPRYEVSLDSNHFLIRDYLRYCCGGYTCTTIGLYPAYQGWLRGVKITAIDTSRAGGVLLDWLVCTDYRIVMVEIKTPEAVKADKFEPGERWTLEELGASARVVVTDEDVDRLFEWLVE